MLGDIMAVGDDATLCFLSTFQREVEQSQGSFESRMNLHHMVRMIAD